MRLRWRPGALVLALGCMAVPAGCRHAVSTAPPAPPAVTVARPLVRAIADYLDFTGNTAPVASVTIVARVEGYLEQIHFTDGASVRKDDLLFTIQQEQYEAQLKEAEAQVLAQETARRHAQTELERYSHLLKQDAATQTTVDHWRAQKETAEAALLGAQAQVELAKLNLSYTLVRAPIDGRIGRHLVDPGNLVGAMGQQTSLAVIEQIDPLYVYFTIDERRLLRVRERRAATVAPPLRAEPVAAAFGLLTEDGYPHAGHLDFAAVGVAPTTGTLQVRGLFPNPEHAILPGMFVRVRVHAPFVRDALLVPGAAISFDQQGEYVLIANDRNVVERRSVKTGNQDGALLVIENGLQPNDRVIVDGILQAVPGHAVTPRGLDDPLATAAPAGD